MLKKWFFSESNSILVNIRNLSILTNILCFKAFLPFFRISHIMKHGTYGRSHLSERSEYVIHVYGISQLSERQETHIPGISTVNIHWSDLLSTEHIQSKVIFQFYFLNKYGYLTHHEEFSIWRFILYKQPSKHEHCLCESQNVKLWAPREKWDSDL